MFPIAPVTLMTNMATALQVVEPPWVSARARKTMTHAIIWIRSQRFRMTCSTFLVTEELADLERKNPAALEQKEPTAPPTPDAPSTIPIASVDSWREWASTRNIRMRACDTTLVMAKSEEVSKIRRSRTTSPTPSPIPLVNCLNVGHPAFCGSAVDPIERRLDTEAMKEIASARNGRKGPNVNRSGPIGRPTSTAAWVLASTDACRDLIFSRSISLFRQRRSASVEKISSTSSASIASTRKIMFISRPNIKRAATTRRATIPRKISLNSMTRRGSRRSTMAPTGI